MSTRRTAPEQARSARWNHRRPAGLLLAVLLALGQAAGAAIVQQAQPAGDEAILSIKVNGIPKGEFFVVKTAQDFWIAAADVPKLQLVGVAPDPALPNAYVSLRSLGPERVAFDDADLALHVDFPAIALTGTKVDLSGRMPRIEVSDAPTSLILSYRLANRTAASGRKTAAETDTNLRLGPLLLRQEHVLEIGDAGTRSIRGRSQAIYDQPAEARRWVAGDVLATAGPFGSSATGAGVMVSKVWGMNPELIRQPHANLRATTALPADIELSVDGATVYRGAVGPGPIDLENLYVYGGRRDVRLTITDITGRRQVVDQPYFFADTVLAKGVHDYSYFVGRRSELDANNRIRYVEPAALAYHRYGLADWITIGAGGERGTDFTTAGAGITLRSDMLGLVSLDLLRNRDRVLGRTHKGWAARYTLQTPRFSAIAGWRAFDDDFRTFLAGASLFPTREARASMAMNFGRTSLGAEWVRAVNPLETRTTAALRLQSSFGQGSLLSAELRDTAVNGRHDRGLALIYRTFLDPLNWVGGNADITDRARSVSVEVGRQVPVDTGFGYRATLTDTSQQGSHTQSASLTGTLNTRPAALELTAAGTRPGGLSYSEAAVTGAVVAVDGQVGLSRLVGDSFVLAKLGAPLPGVDILLNSQTQARTDAAGQAFLPSVAPFDRQEVSVDDKNVPMTYQFDRRALLIAPPYRGGVVVNFDVRRMRAVTGVAWQVLKSQRTRLASTTLRMTGATGTFDVETEATGDFYVEHAPPGTYTGVLRKPGGTLDCKLVVPENDEPVVELKDGITCE